MTTGRARPAFRPLGKPVVAQYTSLMCGRFFLLASPPELADLFGLADVPDAAPRYNIAPTQPVMAVGLDKAGLPAVASLRWGLVPRWAHDTKLAPINARSETAADKPMFAEAIRKRRCLIPASGFFEWLRRGKAKQPFCHRMADDWPFAFAGIWEAWRPESGPPLLTCAILTTAANDLVRPIHDRKPRATHAPTLSLPHRLGGLGLVCGFPFERPGRRREQHSG